MDVVGGHEVDAGPQGELGQRVVAGGVERVAVVPQLDGDVGAAEQRDQPGELVGRRGRALLRPARAAPRPCDNR